MALTKRKTRITARRVAEILGCSPKTVYNGGAGTERLTRVQNGSRQIRFLLEEVLALAEQQEQRGQPKPSDLSH
jgi:DNA-binding CsgD family transcriptional regulator